MSSNSFRRGSIAYKPCPICASGGKLWPKHSTILKGVVECSTCGAILPSDPTTKEEKQIKSLLVARLQIGIAAAMGVL